MVVELGKLPLFEELAHRLSQKDMKLERVRVTPRGRVIWVRGNPTQQERNCWHWYTTRGAVWEQSYEVVQERGTRRGLSGVCFEIIKRWKSIESKNS